MRIKGLADQMPAGKSRDFFWRISRLGLARNFEAHTRYAEARELYSDVLERFPEHRTAKFKISALTDQLNTD
jgi:capsule polysaccharide modification protein KpsS